MTERTLAVKTWVSVAAPPAAVGAGGGPRRDADAALQNLLFALLFVAAAIAGLTVFTVWGVKKMRESQTGDHDKDSPFINPPAGDLQKAGAAPASSSAPAASTAPAAPAAPESLLRSSSLPASSPSPLEILAAQRKLTAGAGDEDSCFEPPDDPFERHRWTVAVENYGQDAAAGIIRALKGSGYELFPDSPDSPDFAAADAADAPGGSGGSDAPDVAEKVPPEEAPVWIYAGPGPNGAAALAAVRRLEAFGVRCTVRLLTRRERLGSLAEREYRTLFAARVPLLESPKRRPTTGALVLATAGTQGELSPAQREDLTAVLEEAARRGRTVVELDDFDPAFLPSKSMDADLLFPVPRTPVTREVVRLMDVSAQEDFHMSGAALMENAGRRAAWEIYLEARAAARERRREGASAAASDAVLEEEASPRVVVVCGKGNNGGDGFVAARHLFGRGLEPRVFLLGEKIKAAGDAGMNLRLLEEAGVEVVEVRDAAGWTALAEELAAAHLAVDGILGTGLTGAVRGAAAEAIPLLNEARRSGARVTALDSPSGLDCNTGEVVNLSVAADVTVTFAATKEGFTRGRGPELCGRVLAADIGFPRELYRRFSLLPKF